jgi:uroporphyrinogen decarboxylase
MANLSSRERVLKALRHEIPDRVPYMELYIDEDFALRTLGLPPRAIPSPMSGSAPVTVAYFGGQGYEPLELASALKLDGLCLGIQPRIYFQTRVSEGQNFVTGGLIKNRKDLKIIDLPDPDDPAIYETAGRLLAHLRTSELALGCFINLGSDPVVLSMGWENLSYALYDDPPLVEELFDIYTTWIARSMHHICQLDFDFIWAGDDIAFKSGPMISPKVFRSLFIPYWRRVVDEIRLPWIFHTDGNFLPVLDDLLSLGMNALHPLEPEAVDICSLKRRIGDRVTLVGNIEINTLSNGTVQEVETLTRDTLRQVAPGGGFILSSSNSLTRSCRVENVLGMINACSKYGKYPIEIH